MAAVTSTTACAPITSHHNTGGSLPELTRDLVIRENDIITIGIGSTNNRKEIKLHTSSSIDKTTTYSFGSGIADKIHGLTEKFHNLSHHRSDSDCESRSRAGTCTSPIYLSTRTNKKECFIPIQNPISASRLGVM